MQVFKPTQKLYIDLVAKYGKLADVYYKVRSLEVNGVGFVEFDNATITGLLGCTVRDAYTKLEACLSAGMFRAIMKKHTGNLTRVYLTSPKKVLKNSRKVSLVTEVTKEDLNNNTATEIAVYALARKGQEDAGRKAHHEVKQLRKEGEVAIDGLDDALLSSINILSQTKGQLDTKSLLNVTGCEFDHTLGKKKRSWVIDFIASKQIVVLAEGVKVGWVNQETIASQLNLSAAKVSRILEKVAKIRVAFWTSVYQTAMNFPFQIAKFKRSNGGTFNCRLGGNLYLGLTFTCRKIKLVFDGVKLTNAEITRAKKYDGQRQHAFA